MGHFRKQTISFFLTSKCNLKCKYCYMPKVGMCDKKIDVAFASHGLREYLPNMKNPAIRFFSAGEPTMAFEEMKIILREAKKITSKPISVELQTNGFFNDVISKWVWDNVDILWISCDGPPVFQDNQRPTMKGSASSDLVYKNIKLFSSHPTMQFGVRTTFMPEYFDCQKLILDFFRDMNVKYVCGAPAYSSQVNSETDIPLLLDFAKNFVPAFYHAQQKKMFYQTHLMVNFDEEVKCYCRTCSTATCPQFTSDGYVSCCDWASFGPKYLPGPMQQCIWGKWDERSQKIIYYEDRKKAIENRNVDYLEKGDCAGCSVIKHCAGGCMGKVMSVTKDIYKMDPNWCTAVKFLAKHIPTNRGRFPVLHS